MQATKPVKDPRKQRKRLYNSPGHLRHKLMAAPLSPELISSKGVRSLPVRKGDTVRVVRGDHTGFEGKVNRVDLKKYRIFIEGLTREKVDGTNIFVSVHPSKVMIRNLKLNDKWRKAIVESKKKQAPSKKEKKIVKVAEKRLKKAEEEKPTREKTIVQEEPMQKTSKPAPKRIQKKPAKKTKALTMAKKKLPEKKPTAERKTAQKKLAATTKEKASAKKKKEAVAEKASPKKEKKPKVMNKALAMRKKAVSKKEGGK